MRSFKLFELQKGQKLQGIVTKLVKNGLFLDVGVGKDGFVHLSKVASGRVRKADEVASVGEEITAWVHKVKDNGRLELSCRPPIDLSAFEGVQPEEWLSGTVVGIDGSGFYVRVQPPGDGEPQQGKVRRKDIAEGRIKPELEAEVGQQVSVRVLHVDKDKKLLDLSMLKL